MMELTIDESDKLIKVAHALSSEVRINILKLLNVQSINVIDIAQQLNLPMSTVSTNIKVLEQAGLILTEMHSASRGTMKVCTRNFDDILMNLNMNAGFKNPKNVYQIEMPVGHYMECEVHPTCGWMNGSGTFKPEDEPSSFFHPNRVSAQLLWFRKGYVEYVFPMNIPPDAKIQSIQFSMEICSEAPAYDHDWPSDITYWVNGKELATWTCPGDFGDRRGKLNPPWMPDRHTQYGLLKTWKINNNGSFFDDVKISDINLENLQLDAKNKTVRLRIGIKPKAFNIGGINIFGREFGDHEQGIIMRVIFDPS
jgi:predicted transcriptional regulator